MAREVAVVVRTKDRAPKRKNYLGETLSNALRAGVFTSPHLHSFYLSCHEVRPEWLDDEVPPEVRDLRVPGGVSVGVPGSTFHQDCARAISVGVDSGARLVMVLEDDVDFCADFLGSAVRWLADVARARERYPMYVFGANYDAVARQAQRGHHLWRYPVREYYGNQALLWRRAVAASLVRWLGPDPSYNGVRDHGHDLLLHKWGAHVGAQHFAASCPSFVQHIGEDSGLNNKFFRFPSWPGREWRYGA